MRGRIGQEEAPRLAEAFLSLQNSLRCLLACLSALSPLSAHLARLICPAHVAQSGELSTGEEAGKRSIADKQRPRQSAQAEACCYPSKGRALVPRALVPQALVPRACAGFSAAGVCGLLRQARRRQRRMGLPDKTVLSEDDKTVCPAPSP